MRSASCWSDSLDFRGWNSALGSGERGLGSGAGERRWRDCYRVIIPVYVQMTRGSLSPMVSAECDTPTGKPGKD